MNLAEYDDADSEVDEYANENAYFANEFQEDEVFAEELEEDDFTDEASVEEFEPSEEADVTVGEAGTDYNAGEFVG